MPNSDQILRMRAAASSQLPETCTIYAPPSAGDDQGGESVVDYPAGWTQIAVGVACDLEAARPQSQEKQAAGGVKAVTDFILTLPYNTAIKANYRVRITSLGNRDFEVLGNTAGAHEIVRVLNCAEVQTS